MFELTGLNGDAILVVVKAIFRLTPSRVNEDPPVTKVEYGGGYIFTHERLNDLIDRMAELKIVKLTTRSGSPVYLNAGSISRIREALPINRPGTEIVVGGQYQHVLETVDEVTALIA